MNNFVEKFKEIETNLISEQRRYVTNSCLMVYYGITVNKRYRISFVSSIKPYELESTKEIKVTQGKESEGVYWTCFDLNNDETKDVFFIFCESLVDAIKDKEDEHEAMSSLKDRYYAWKMLLKNNRKMTYESYQGLFGELYFLSEILSKNNKIDDIISCWVGPNGYSKDFSLNNTWYEIKTIGTSSTSVKINSLTQLDSNEIGHLIVVIVEKMSEEYDVGLCSVRALYRNILSKIESHEVRENFINKVLEYGFVDEEENINNYKFDVKKIESYKVDSRFPKLTRENVDNHAINKVCYEILIGSIEEFKENL